MGKPFKVGKTIATEGELISLLPLKQKAHLFFILSFNVNDYGEIYNTQDLTQNNLTGEVTKLTILTVMALGHGT